MASRWRNQHMHRFLFCCCQKRIEKVRKWAKKKANKIVHCHCKHIFLRISVQRCNTLLCLLGIPSTENIFARKRMRDSENSMKAQLINYMTRIFSFYNFTHAFEIGFIYVYIIYFVSFFFSSVTCVVDAFSGDEIKLCKFLWQQTM